MLSVVSSTRNLEKGRNFIMHRRTTRALSFLALLLALFTAFSLVSPGLEAAGGTSSQKKVVGYVPYWRSGYFSQIPYDQVTHLNYAFAIPTAEGGLRPLENAQAARQLIQTAHQKGGKVLLAVGGWSYNGVVLEPTFAAATATEAKRKAFADAIIAMCDQYGFDGVDMDWEHPRLKDGTYRQYEALMLDLAQRLHAKGKLLTSAVLCGVSPEGAVYSDSAAHTDAVLQAVDWINVMAYDGDEGARHSTYQFARYSGDYWHKTRGVPAEKVVLGLPFYARPGGTAYRDILSAVPNAHLSDSVTYQGRTVWYNGLSTIQAKTRYARDELGGVMIWEITQDTSAPAKSLLSAITRTLREDASHPFTDLVPGSWYYEDVCAAYEAGLMKGTGGTSFSPLRTLTRAEGIALASRIHDRHHNGRETISPGSPWYQPYVDYARTQGILTQDLSAAELSAPLTRAEFATFLARSLPGSALPPINTVERIPDLAESDLHGPAVYQLYRAGIFAGSDASGSFRPNSVITRAETAALVVRMTDPDRRVSFSLTG